MRTLLGLLAEDVALWADAGGKRKQAALRPIRGRDAVARFSVGTMRFLPEGYAMELANVNGQAAAIIRNDDEVFAVLTVDAAVEHIRTIYVIANPEKLARVA